MINWLILVIQNKTDFVVEINFYFGSTYLHFHDGLSAGASDDAQMAQGVRFRVDQTRYQAFKVLCGSVVCAQIP